MKSCGWSTVTGSAAGPAMTNARSPNFVLVNGGLIESHTWSVERRAIFNDLERPKIQISRSGHFLTLNVSEMSKDAAIVTIGKANRKPYQSFQMVPFSITLIDL